MSTTNTLNIGIDLDGVTYDFVGALRSYITATTGRPEHTMPEPTVWEFYEHDWGLNLTEFLTTCHAAVNEGHMFTYGPPLPGAGDGMRALDRAGHHLHIVTDRLRMGDPDLVKKATIEWLHAWDIPYKTLTFSHDKTSVPVDVFVDDKPDNYHALTAAGIDTYLMVHPYNTHVPAPENRRVHTFDEFAAAFLSPTILSPVG